MDIEFGLVTSAALPARIKQSDSFLSVDEEQWVDLRHYAAQLEAENKDEKVLVLIVAHGTPEQRAAEEEQAAIERRDAARAEEMDAQRRAQEEAEREEKSRLRERSEEIFNALYGR